MYIDHISFHKENPVYDPIKIEMFSLRDEIRLYRNMEIKIELNDKTPFDIKPFPIKEEENIIADKEVEKMMFAWNLEKRL